MNLISHQTNSLNGEVLCPGDKSISQRILIIGFLTNSAIKISGFLDAEDPNSTLEALNAIGAAIKKDDDLIYLNKRENLLKSPNKDLDLGNSGTGMRLILGLISGLGISATLVGDKSLSKRPMYRVINPLKAMGAEIQSNKGMAPLKILGGKIINDFKYEMPIASAQVKSSLMLAALSSNNSITISEPKTTRDHTERMVEYFGGDIKYGDKKNRGIIELNAKKLRAVKSYDIVGDFSSAAFIIVAVLISSNSKVLIKNVGLNSSRSGLLEILSLMGANIEIKNKKMTCNEDSGDILIQSSSLHAIDIPEDIIPNIIDEIPILSIAAAFAEGTTYIRNASELRVKETDRINAISEGLKKLNVNHEVFDDGLSISGTNNSISSDQEIDSFGDHRIAMSFLIAGIRSTNSIKVRNCKNIETSFPKFKDIMNKLGMEISE
ncbi:MAG: 3-phosphoshikimate 1-carboxyvinyltransferase [Gammaproteobacteria bacterium]|nr:3-phosphoshikimate 1-carboxyvinyltransferase [Gammaproteobacteria bacterium]